MTEKDKLYAEELRKRALADYERLDHAIDELERQTCDTPRNNLAEPSQDCISRETAIDQFIHWYSELLLSQKEEVSFKDILKSLPSVLPQHKKGKWIRYDVDIAFHPLHCSICGWSNHHIINKCIEEFQFCPNCGADMRESEE